MFSRGGRELKMSSGGSIVKKSGLGLFWLGHSQGHVLEAYISNTGSPLPRPQNAAVESVKISFGRHPSWLLALNIK